MSAYALVPPRRRGGRWRWALWRDDDTARRPDLSGAASSERGARMCLGDALEGRRVPDDEARRWMGGGR